MTTQGCKRWGTSLPILQLGRLESCFVQSVDQVCHRPVRLNGKHSLRLFMSILTTPGSSFTFSFPSIFGMKYPFISPLLSLLNVKTSKRWAEQTLISFQNRGFRIWFPCTCEFCHQCVGAKAKTHPMDQKPADAECLV